MYFELTWAGFVCFMFIIVPVKIKQMKKKYSGQGCILLPQVVYVTQIGMLCFFLPCLIFSTT
ncbi:hypothetical protein HanIR_Chr03g0128801 [Helianthus annuus]|nr:hypothetical protein HanIR_Chr03g0128801 [Helianthus annuus]